MSGACIYSLLLVRQLVYACHRDVFFCLLMVFVAIVAFLGLLYVPILAFHRPMLLSCVPTRTVLPSFLTLKTFLRNVMSHPASLHFCTPSSHCANPRTMCALVTCAGMSGISRLHVCIETSIFLFGSIILIGSSATSLFSVGASVTRKCPVAPESMIAYVASLIFFLNTSACNARDSFLL